jgi:hypothetical protein
MTTYISGENMFWISLKGSEKIIIASFGAIYPTQIDGESLRFSLAGSRSAPRRAVTLSRVGTGILRLRAITGGTLFTLIISLFSMQEGF